jgi:hypothetical protein
MTTDLRALLTEVAEGRLAPARAAEMLDELPGGSAGSHGPADPAGRTAAAADPESSDNADAARRAGTAGAAASADSRSTSARPSVQGVERVRVTASARPVRIIGDPTVATATVDGPHTVTVEAGMLRVEAGSPASAAGQSGSYAYERKTGLSRWLSQAGSVGVPLTVRMNPVLAADAEVLAGSLELVGLTGPVTFSVTAGSVRLRDCSGVANGVVRAGSAQLEVRPTAGAWSVRVESGSVDLRLLPGSDVRVNGQADLGEFKVRGADGSLKLHKTDRLPEYVLGAGTATFDVHVAMGSAKVTLP